MENVTCINLDAALKSSLDWSNELITAKNLIESGSKILWKLDFGLFDRLQYPLASQQQFQGLRLAIEHFQAEIWGRFAENSSGTIVYEGPLDSIEVLNLNNIQAWASERFEDCNVDEICSNDKFLQSLYCRDVALDYLKQLASQMPFGVDCFIQPQISAEMTLVEQAIFLNKECYSPLDFWQQGNNLSTNIGICLPPITCYIPESHRQLDTAIQQLLSNGSLYRFIAEEALITNIEGLDELYVASRALSAQGKRKLQGFIAAGGQVHYLD